MVEVQNKIVYEMILLHYFWLTHALKFPYPTAEIPSQYHKNRLHIWSTSLQKHQDITNEDRHAEKYKKKTM